MPISVQGLFCLTQGWEGLVNCRDEQCWNTVLRGCSDRVAKNHKQLGGFELATYWWWQGVWVGSGINHCTTKVIWLKPTVTQVLWWQPLSSDLFFWLHCSISSLCASTLRDRHPERCSEAPRGGLDLFSGIETLMMHKRPVRLIAGQFPVIYPSALF